MEDIKRCCDCPYKDMDRHLEYYNFPYCKVNGREIAFNENNGWDIMKWCPIKNKEKD